LATSKHQKEYDMNNSKMLRLKPFLKKTCENFKSDTTMLTQQLEQVLEQNHERSEEMLKT
jgi:hypothetical protein